MGLWKARIAAQLKNIQSESSCRNYASPRAERISWRWPVFVCRGRSARPDI